MGRVTRSKLQNIKNIKKAVEARKRKQEEREREREREREQPTASTSSAPATPCTSHNTTAGLSSAKKRKLEVGQTAADIVPIYDENIILKKSYLRELFTNVACSQCYGQSLKVQFVNKYLDFKLHLKCEDCGNECGDGKVDDTPITNTLVYSTMEVGLGFTSYNKLISNMSMTPLYGKYQDTQRHILQKTEQKAREVMEKTRDAVKRHYTPDQDGIYNIKVIYDGSWQKRGHTSKLAVGAVVEAHTGCVIDYETVSKFCEKCTKKENTKISKEDMEEWKKGHQQECLKNYDGSSGGMETAAALKLFGRSLTYNLRYTVFISDGDSSAYNAICALNNNKGPYNGVCIEKGECINHVGKRLGTALRKVREQVVSETKTKTGKTRRLKVMGGKGKLTDFVIGKLQKYYSAAIRRHVGGSVKDLRNDIYASFLHCSSTDENPQHQLCPKSTESYCFYQSAIAKKKTPPSHKTMRVHFVLPSEMRQKVWAEYKRLTTDTLLKACLLGKTQNPNEHLHSRIWRFCSKYKNANKNILDFAVAQAVLDYNVGYREGFMVPEFGEPFTWLQESYLKRNDQIRERNRLKNKKKTLEGEGDEYKAGAF